MGRVSKRNGLGQSSYVEATDDQSFANAFGITGVLGQVYSNQKIGMLKLKGDTKHSEVAIDPTEMQRIESLDYARQNSNEVVDFGALANSLMTTNQTEMISKLRSAIPNADITILSNQARGELAKFLLELTDAESVRKTIADDDPNDALLDAIKREAVSVVYQQTSTAGGVEFDITAKGTTAVKIEPSSKLIKIRVTMEGHVAGSAGSAGARYKKSFVDIKREVLSVSKTGGVDRNIRYDPEDDIESITINVRALLTQTTRKMVKQEVAKVEEKFADIENFNPASVKARLWRELNLSSSEISQSKLDEDALRMYANKEITAFQFANMEENGLTGKLKKVIVNRLSKADAEIFSERVEEAIHGEKQIESSSLKGQVEGTIDRLIDEIETISSFNEAYEKYTVPNAYWEKMIVELTIKSMKDSDQSDTITKDSIETIKQKLRVDVNKRIEERAVTYYLEFLKGAKMRPNCGYDQPNIPYQVIDELKAQFEEALATKKYLNEGEENDITEGFSDPIINRKIEEMTADKFDYDLAVFEARRILADLVSETEPYSKKDKGYWYDRSGTVNNLEVLADYIESKNIDQFVSWYAPYWDSKNLEKDSWLTRKARTALKSAFENKLFTANVVVINKYKIPTTLLDHSDFKIEEKIASQIADEELDNFFEGYHVDHDNANEVAWEFADTFAGAFYENRIEEKMDFEKIRNRIISEITSQLNATVMLNEENKKELSEQIKRESDLKKLGEIVTDFDKFLEENKQSKPSDIEAYAKDKLKRNLLSRYLIQLRKLVEDYQFDRKIVSELELESIPKKLTNDQIDIAFEGLLEEVGVLSEETMPDAIDNYLTTYYDNDYLYNSVERRFDMGEIVEFLTDEILENLKTDPLCRNLSSDYWLEKIRSVRSVTELSKYRTESQLTSFLETYAPDWKEELQES